MSITVEWPDIVVRLLCTIAAGLLIGFDRGEHGRPAGLRTTLLVALAACLAMLQVNLLMGTSGKPLNSFVNIDVMRLPLGILSGMGFIGAGAIIRRENGVLGVTTAATLWFATVLGLTFGGGQIALGAAGLLAGMLVLTGLRPVEARTKQDRQATLTVVTTTSGPSTESVRSTITAEGYKIVSCGLVQTSGGENQELTFQISWRATAHDSTIPEFISRLSVKPGVIKVAWSPRTTT